MAGKIIWGGSAFDINRPYDISIGLQEKNEAVNCYYAPPYKTSPVVIGDFIGDLKQGSPVNYRNVAFNPHGNGTHTECLAHIADVPVSMSNLPKGCFFLSQVLSAQPREQLNGDFVIMEEDVIPHVLPGIEALILRTIPNETSKKVRQYSGTNPAYIDPKIGSKLATLDILHFLTDLPSLDKEVDEGKLLAHRAFWQYPESPRLEATITELVFIDDQIADGSYLLNLQVANFDLDAAPSRPIIFPLITNE